jgi:hypothetical protein
MLRWKEVEEERGVEIQHHGLVYGGWRICRIFGLQWRESFCAEVAAGKSKIRMNLGSHDLDHGTALFPAFSSFRPINLERRCSILLSPLCIGLSTAGSISAVDLA